MIVRILASLWSVVALSSVVSVVRALVAGKATRVSGDVVNQLVERTKRLGKIERYCSLALMVAVFVAFFSGSLNTALWPFATLAWIALLAQSMFLRPYLTNFASLMERGFDRPIERILLPYVALDIVMLIVLSQLIVRGTV